MILKCIKELKGSVRGRDIHFEVGEVLKIKTKKDGYDYVVKDGYDFFIDWNKRGIREYFEKIDDELEELLKILNGE